MKSTILILQVFIGICTYGQKVALLDMKLKQPIIYTDSVTVEQITKNLIPVEINNFDTLYANLKYLQGMLEKRQRSKMESFELRAGSTKIITTRIPFAYGDRYSIVLQSTNNEITGSFTLANGKKLNKDSAEDIQHLMNYMTQNQSLFKSPNEITPKIYNIQVIKD